MATQRVLFVNQTGVMSGAEYVLASVTQQWPEASAFLLEGGPLVDVLQKNGLNVSVAAPDRGLGTIRRDQSVMAALPLAAQLTRLISRIVAEACRHDVVYANSQKAFLLCAIGSFLFRRPLIWHLHDILNEQHFGRAQRRLQVTLANSRATCVIVPSQAAADAFVDAGGRAELLRIVPNGVDLTPQPEADRCDLDLPQGPLVGVFSRLARWKGQHIVLEALRSLPDIKCVLVGSPLFGEDDYLKELEAIVAQHGLADRVRFLGQRSDVAALMRAVNAVIHSSVDPEPFGLTLVEAMVAGTPVIATDCGASAEILDNGKAGELVPAGDVPALAQAIKRRFTDAEPFLAKAKIARARAEEHYGVVRMRHLISQIITVASQ